MRKGAKECHTWWACGDDREKSVAEEWKNVTFT